MRNSPKRCTHQSAGVPGYRYLLFRGFSDTLQAFNAEVKADKASAVRAALL
jgi:hypothetical protein